MNSLHLMSASKNNSTTSKRPTREIPCDGCAWAPKDSAVRCVLLFLDALTAR